MKELDGWRGLKEAFIAFFLFFDYDSNSSKCAHSGGSDHRATHTRNFADGEVFNLKRFFLYFTMLLGQSVPRSSGGVCVTPPKQNSKFV